eukprot:1157260-Pelagomonas_calceolata.AAC.6
MPAHSLLAATTATCTRTGACMGMWECGDESEGERRPSSQHTHFGQPTWPPPGHTFEHMMQAAPEQMIQGSKRGRSPFDAV